MGTTNTLRLQVTSICHIQGQGTVLAGSVESGRIAVGQKADLVSAGSRARVRIDGIEELGGGELLGRAEAGLAVAVLIKNLDLESVADGIRRIDPLTVEPVDLWLVGV